MIFKRCDTMDKYSESFNEIFDYYMEKIKKEQEPTTQSKESKYDILKDRERLMADSCKIAMSVNK